jgi:hypothetical protein
VGERRGKGGKVGRKVGKKREGTNEWHFPWLDGFTFDFTHLNQH